MKKLNIGVLDIVASTFSITLGLAFLGSFVLFEGVAIRFFVEELTMKFTFHHTMLLPAFLLIPLTPIVMLVLIAKTFLSRPVSQM